MKQLFSIIREQRRRYRLSQTELAGKTGISRASLSQIENGTITDIGIRKVERVLEYLGLELTVRPAGAPPTLDELRDEQESEKGRS